MVSVAAVSNVHDGTYCARSVSAGSISGLRAGSEDIRKRRSTIDDTIFISFIANTWPMQLGRIGGQRDRRKRCVLARPGGEWDEGEGVVLLLLEES